MPEQTQTTSRPPIVVVLGHVDHGKSTLLDYIRKSNTVDKEAGGITQSIAAYEIEYEGKRITFIDTPGHAAFQAMRKRGASVADIAVLVIAADDGVKPQTLEALAAIKEAQTPFIVAINKIDKPNANIERTKQTLAEADVFVEGYGGTVPVAEVSAKSGKGVEDLLALILLSAEIEEFTATPNKKAEGIVIEAHHAGKRGIVATLIVKDGTLSKGDYVATPSAFAPVRQLSDTLGTTLESASFSTPVIVSDWCDSPISGENFASFASKKEAENFVKVAAHTRPVMVKKDVMIPILLKADRLGMLEAIEGELAKRESDKVGVTIVSSGIGTITEGDVKLIQGAQAPLIIGFNVEVDRHAQDVIEKKAMHTEKFDIIYKLTEWFDSYVATLVPKEVTEVRTGSAKILKCFSRTRDKQIVGGKVTEGAIESGIKVRILRRDEQIGEGSIVSLEQNREAAKKVESGQQFGTVIEAKLAIVEGDVIEQYKALHD
ncbi:MAG TPA: translation initiation factor IF-2 [Candidatus Paceibacterota bacterium]